MGLFSRCGNFLLFLNCGLAGENSKCHTIITFASGAQAASTNGFPIRDILSSCLLQSRTPVSCVTEMEVGSVPWNSLVVAGGKVTLEFEVRIFFPTGHLEISWQEWGAYTHLSHHFIVWQKHIKLILNSLFLHLWVEVQEVRAISDPIDFTDLGDFPIRLILKDKTQNYGSLTPIWILQTAFQLWTWLYGLYSS